MYIENIEQAPCNFFRNERIERVASLIIITTDSTFLILKKY